jgi:hypothetical protein
MGRSAQAKKVMAARSGADATTAAGEARWRSVEDAAAFLGMPTRVLREELARNARAEGDTVESRLDGILGRKLGRRWKVWLAEKWTAPEPALRHGVGRGAVLPVVDAGHAGKVLPHGRP